MAPHGRGGGRHRFKLNCPRWRKAVGASGGGGKAGGDQGGRSFLMAVEAEEEYWIWIEALSEAEVVVHDRPAQGPAAAKS